MNDLLGPILSTELVKQYKANLYQNTMKKEIRVPEELSYSNRLRNDFMAKVLYNKEIEAPEACRFFAYIIIPDFGLYNFSDN